MNMRELAKMILNSRKLPTSLKGLKDENLADLMVKNGFLQVKGKQDYQMLRKKYIATNKLWKKYSN